MIRGVRVFAETIAAVLIVTVGGFLLFWLGRTPKPVRSELVVDEGLLE